MRPTANIYGDASVAGGTFGRPGGGGGGVGQLSDVNKVLSSVTTAALRNAGRPADSVTGGLRPLPYVYASPPPHPTPPVACACVTVACVVGSYTAAARNWDAILNSIMNVLGALATSFLMPVIVTQVCVRGAV